MRHKTSFFAATISFAEKWDGERKGHIIMEKAADRKTEFHELSVAIKAFILEESSLVHIEDSNEVVDGGAYKWKALSEESKQTQQRLFSRYVRLIDSIVRENFDEESLDRFACSRDRVLSLLKQDSVVLQDTNEKVYEDITEELKLQAWLSKAL